MSIADKLDEARALIEKGWTQHVFARDSRGHALSLMSADATCFCAIGAIERVAGGSYSAAPLMTRLERALGVGDAIGVSSFNDAPERTQAEVIDAFKRAAELARQEQSA